ncbi:MAG: mannose-1-phosphate guanylyltransferase/mannose-6-phosphate isomerase [Pseudomonadota bacterium]
MLTPVILSGGAGTRLWPVSREAHPKPFMMLPEGRSLLQKTLLRVAGIPGVQRVLTLTNREYFFKTKDEYTAVKAAADLAFDYVLEPCGRNTAPAIAMAALRLLEADGPEATLLVLPADHLIEDQAGFERAVQQAAHLARDGYLVTFGIQPNYPETGFGYIETGETLAADAGNGGETVACASGLAPCLVKCFVEKPDFMTATEYVACGRFLWNSGMFCFKAETFLDALREHAPEVHERALRCWEATACDSAPVELDGTHFANMPDISIDYAVMEKAARVAVVPGDFGWSDIGSWSAVSELTPPDEMGNRVAGEAVLVDSTNCFVQSDGRLVAAVGVDNLIVVDTPDALLIANRDRAQDVKKVVQELKLLDHEAYRLHRTVSRPWGTYTVLEEGRGFKMKRIVVKPGAALSLQMHHHRSEHWVVVSGTARVVNGDGEILVRTNESTYIPAGTPHRLINPGVIDLVMIEVQSGEYLGEDDIVRFDDRYGRA